jgi:hypothetical protein
MRVISPRMFRRRFPQRAPILRRPLARLARTPRHVAWALALVERLVRRVLLAVHREDPILRRAARHWIRCSQTVTLRSGAMNSAGQILMRERPVIHPRESTRGLNGVPVSAATATNGRRFALAPFPRELSRSLQPEATVLGTMANRSHVAAALDTALRRQPGQEAYAQRLVPLRPMPLNSNSGSLRRVATGLTSAESLPYRITLQHRRVEEDPLARGLKSEGKKTPSLLPDLPLAVENPQLRVRRKSAGDTVSPGERRDHAGQPEVNVTQIADAVLQQLDRRLIAARERMGRT